MRPIQRGDVPKNKDGTEKVFNPYGLARGPLIDRLGQYCSFCESRCGSDLAVEHKLSQHFHKDKEHCWDNFLLACRNCNSTKGHEDLRLDDYYWPDTDNTFEVLCYSEGGRIAAATALTAVQEAKAVETLKLTGLDKRPSPTDPERSDRRWNNRRNAWDLAERQRAKLERNRNADFLETVVELALQTGFFSVWMTVFAGDVEMQHRLINKFNGTSRKYFTTPTTAPSK